MNQVEPAAKFLMQNISKTYDEKDEKIEVIHDFSLQISERESVVMLGPSGCGKSTLLKIAGGILPATSGHIHLDGVDYGLEIPREEVNKFGFIFQDSNLLKWRTAEDNLKLILEVMGLKGPKWDSRVAEMLDVVGLLAYKDVYPHELSGGMKQRVGIARALVHNPEILILDQSFGALDAITRKMLSYETLKILKKTQKTMLMVTNRIDEAVLLANRVLVLSDKPLSILKEITIDIPLEERDKDIMEDRKFLNYCNQINAVLRQTL